MTVEDRDGDGKEDQEGVNEHEKEQKIGDTLKHVGNLKKRK